MGVPPVIFLAHGIAWHFDHHISLWHILTIPCFYFVSLLSLCLPHHVTVWIAYGYELRYVYIPQQVKHLALFSQFVFSHAKWFCFLVVRVRNVIHILKKK